MNSPALLYALRWLVRDTFRQALAGKVFWILLGLSGLAIVFCLGVSIEGGVEREDGFLYGKKTGEDLVGPNPEPGRLSLLFGAFRIPIARGEEEEVHLIQVLLATWVAGTVGLLFTLVWTAGFVPEALQPAAASVLLAKPTPRWVILLGKYLGVVLFVAFQSLIFFAGTWIALGVKTGVWNSGYLAGIPLLTLQFAGLFAFSVLLAVLTRNTVACVLGILIFWAICLGVNYGRHAALALPVMQPGTELPAFTFGLLNLGYWLLPKPMDMLIVLEEVLDAGRLKATLSGIAEFQTARSLGEMDPVLSMVSTALFVVLVLGVAAYQLGKTDY